MTPETGKPAALVFRKRLLAYSETFVANQGYALRRHRPVFVGFEQDQGGLHHLDRADVCLLSDFARNVDLARLPMRCGLPPPRAWMRALAATKPRIVHTHFVSAAKPGRQIADALGLPMIVTAHGNDVTNPLTPAFRRQLQTAFGRCDRVIAVSGFIADRLAEAGCPDDKLVQHYMGIPLEQLDASPVPEAPVVLFVGRFVEKKGIAYLMRAMAQVRARHPNARLRLIGDGPLRESLVALDRELGLESEFLGVQPPQAVHAAMRSARVLAAPSVRTERDAEGLGMVFLEAQALGRPVVGFRSGGIGEAVSHGETALLSEERDVDALAADLSRVLGDLDLAQSLGTAGAERVRRLFDIRIQTESLEALYDEVVRQGALVSR